MTQQHIAIIGSHGAIGSALAAILMQPPHDNILHTFSRHQACHPAHHHSQLEDYSESSIQAASATLDGLTLDQVFVTTGLLHRGDIQPEKSWQEITATHCLALYEANAVVPALVGKYFLDKLTRQRRTIFAALSARVGSISDNRLGGWYAYRASKAALNMIIKTLAIEQQRKNPQSIVVGMHPGTVDSPLSQPFQQRLKPGSLQSPMQSATHLLDMLCSLAPQHTGRCFDWKGEEVPA